MALLAVAGCGGDSGSFDSGSPGQRSAEQRSPVAAARVRATLADFERAVQGAEARRACALLSTDARAQAANLLAGPPGSCATALAKLAKGIEGVEQRPYSVRSVTVAGDRATASVSDAGRPPVDVRFVREGGRWRLATLGIGTATGGVASAP